MNTISFKCPQCGNNELMIIESAINRYAPLHFKQKSDGSIFIQKKKKHSTLIGKLLGFRCIKCCYPDNASPMNEQKDAFAWKTIDDILLAEALVPEGDTPLYRHKCVISHPNGDTTPIIVASHSLAPLTPEQRKNILHHHDAPNACLLCESDKHIKAFSSTNWNKTKQFNLNK